MDDLTLAQSSIKQQLEGARSNFDFPYKTRLSFDLLLSWLGKGNPIFQPIHDKLSKMLDQNGWQDGLTDAESTILFSDINDRTGEIFTPLFPLFGQDQMLAVVTVPFHFSSIYGTPDFLKTFNDPEVELMNSHLDIEEAIHMRTIQAACLILNRHYQANIRLKLYDTLGLRNKKTQLEEHYRLDANFDFVDVVLLKPLQKINEHQIQNLLNDTNNRDLWLEMIPPDSFAFAGFSIGTLIDITQEVITSTIKDEMMNTSSPSISETNLSSGIKLDRF